jgi:NTP pyrophosphatase (non-canonical NTP hydrolase)
MDKGEREKLYLNAILKYGLDKQIMTLFEECGELIDAMAKTYRGRSTQEDVITELADVSIMVEQLAAFYGTDRFEAEKERKLERLKNKLESKEVWE